MNVSYWLDKFSNLELKVLIVEDDHNDALNLARMLEEIGASVTWCETGESAIKVLDTDYDMVLINLSLPGMSGLDFLQALRMRSHHQDTPVAIVTGFNPGCLDKLGVAHVISKPFSRQHLERLLVDFQLATYSTLKHNDDPQRIGSLPEGTACRVVQASGGGSLPSRQVLGVSP